MKGSSEVFCDACKLGEKYAKEKWKVISLERWHAKTHRGFWSHDHNNGNLFVEYHIPRKKTQATARARLGTVLFGKKNKTGRTQYMKKRIIKNLTKETLIRRSNWEKRGRHAIKKKGNSKYRFPPKDRNSKIWEKKGSSGVKRMMMFSFRLTILSRSTKTRGLMNGTVCS